MTRIELAAQSLSKILKEGCPPEDAVDCGQDREWPYSFQCTGSNEECMVLCEALTELESSLKERGLL